MNKSDNIEFISLITDENKNVSYIFEIYHAILEYIKSGNAIYDMGHPDFYMSAIKYPNYNCSSFSPSLTIYQLAKACSNFLRNYDTDLIWFRDLSTWQNFCKYVMEIDQIKFFRRNRRLVKSYKYYVRRIECPACGIQQINFFGERDNVYITKNENLVSIDCRLCGKYILTTGSFKYLDNFEKKSKLYVFLATRSEKNKIDDSIISPKILKEIIE